jgi:hypothetical protein
MRHSNFKRTAILVGICLKLFLHFAEALHGFQRPLSDLIRHSHLKERQLHEIACSPYI